MLKEQINFVNYLRDNEWKLIEPKNLMTFTKMIRLLTEAIVGKESNPFIRYYDRWTESTEPREVVTYNDILEQFKNKSGDVFEKFCSGSDFKELLKIIEKNKPIDFTRHYDDSYNKFKSDWESKHPGEDFEEFRSKRAKEETQKYLQMTKLATNPTIPGATQFIPSRRRHGRENNN